jgi:hypothetical protein
MAYPNALKSLSAKVQGPSYTVKKEREKRRDQA